MRQSIKYVRDKLIVGLVSLMSMSFMTRAPFETNPQDCEMTSVIKKRKHAAGAKNLRA